MRPTRSLFSTVALALFVLLGGCTSSQESVQEGTRAPFHHDVFGEVLPQMPADDQQDQLWLNEQLMDTGPEGLRALLDHLTPPDLGNDTYARYAVSGLTKHVSRTDAESERQMFEEVLLEELEAGRSAPVSVFLLHQLALIGSDRAVPVVKRLLGDDKLFEPAAEVLIRIQTTTATQALRAALTETEEPSKQETLIQALGAVQGASVADDLLPYASAEPWRVRRAALHALARSGEPVASDAFAEAIDTTRGARQRHARSSYLLLVERLAEEGHAAESAEIARRVLEEDSPTHAKQAALSALIQAEGEQALETLLDAGTSADQKVRRGALSLVQELPSQEVTEAFLTRLNTADAPVRADVISMLGQRGDSSTLSSLTPYLRDSDLQTRRAAVETVTALGGAEVLPELMAVLNQAEDTEVIGDIETALLQMPTDRVLPAVAEALPTSTDSTKAVLIRVIAKRRGTQYLEKVLDERKSNDEAVRREAYRALQQLASESELPALVDGLSEVGSEEERAAVKDAIAAVLDRIEDPDDRDEAVSDIWADASDAQQSALVSVLPRVGGDEALRLTVEATGRSETGVRAAAIEALAEWPTSQTQAMPALLRVAGNAGTPDQRTALLKRYVHLMNATDAPNDEKRKRLHKAVSAAESPKEKALLIKTFSSVERSIALAAVGTYLSDQEDIVRENALDVATEHLASFFDPVEDSSESAEAMLAALETTVRPELAQRLERQFADAKGSDSSSSSESAADRDTTSTELFNGDNLDGWESVGGSSGGWDVDDGILYTDGSGQGWLSTTRTYGDFELELEFRVPEGGNSGVFLRTPREGNPAYEGLEIQILDDRSEQYTDLQAWQYTGSVYNVKAPSKQVSRAAGEWQKMKIVAEGPRIQVVLNGERIVNTRLVNHMDRVDEHPGLKRREGYIGLQNHNTHIEYRNIDIRE